MSLKLTRSLWIWAAVLAMVLLFIMPLTGGLRGSIALAIVLALITAWYWSGRQTARQREALALVAGISLPPADYRLPVVLVCGDALEGLFARSRVGEAALRMTPQGCYLQVESPEQLAHMAKSIVVHRPYWSVQLSVLYVVNPGEHSDALVLAGQIQTLRHQLALARRCGLTLPLLHATYLQSSQVSEAWFSWEFGARQPNVREAGALKSLSEWQWQAVDLPIRSARLSNGVHLESVAAWLAEHVVKHLTTHDARVPASPPVVCAVRLVPELPSPVDANLWQQWLRDKTALIKTIHVEQGIATELPFPDPLLPLLPVEGRDVQIRRAGLIALWLFAAAALPALVSSTWQNNLLARQVSDDLRRYHAIPHPANRSQPEFELREAAVTALRQHVARLDDYYRHGEPLQLGLGLYHGEPLRAELLDAVAAYQQPQEMPAIAATPGPVRLSSLSLFSVGSATLKPDATKVLINALVGIKAQPGWLIVIAGHTDATGSAEQNLLLSQARANAVRDWMQRMGDFPDSCFAVQGFGASQPIASNDVEIGRAANRRVDIRLVPEVGACALPMDEPAGHYQSHSAAFNL
ncbi:OmpA family protein [Pseudomonas sp. MAHUQ-62]|uniref:OmpA family protein n=1 Tax=Pseudomonas sp. GCM10023245 TaxID=3252652 RepID=UPI00360990EE